MKSYAVTMSIIRRLEAVYRHLQNSQQEGSLENSNVNDGHDNCEFKYTFSNDLLSKEHRQFYEENGYLVIPKLVPDKILDNCIQRFVDICEGKTPVGNMTLMKDISLAKTGSKGQYLYNKIQNISFDDVFASFMTYRFLLDYVECFIGSNIMAMHSMLINKPPDLGTLSSTHPLHQDLHYFPFRPANKIVGCWTAMEKITVNNGCLIVLPGTHTTTLQQHDYPEQLVNKMYHGIKGFDLHPKVYLEMDKGDTVFFHPLLIHGSGPNITKGFRKAISFHYAASECEYINVKGTIQENIATEVEDLLKKKGLNIDYCTAWKMKARLVRGELINL